MSVLLAIIGGAVLMALAAFIAYVVGTRRAVTALGTPTPAENKIAVDAKAKIESNAATEAARVKEVTNASPDDLVRLAREQVRRDLDDVPTVKTRFPADD